MFLENGFNDFLSKPIDTESLSSILEKWIPREKKMSAYEIRAKASDIAGKHGGKGFAPPKAGNQGDIEIPGVDVRKGIQMTGGTAENYIETLAIYYDDGQSKLGEIKSCLDSYDLSLFVIHVHAIKSASASIGADGISAAAEALEMAGLRMDAKFIHTNVDRFLADLETLLKNIDEALKQALKPVSSKPSQGPADMGAFRSELARLKAAFDAYDAAAINEASRNLQDFVHDPSLSEAIGKILQLKLTGEYEEAALLIDGFMTGGRKDGQ
jgi:HPt (histidine-containing phosphotransfer) domain-containing protein